MSRSPDLKRSRPRSFPRSRERVPTLSTRLLPMALILLCGTPVLPLLADGPGSDSIDLAPGGSPAGASGDPRPESEGGSPPASDPGIDEAVAQLGDSSFAVREEGSRLLLERGDKALPALRRALESSDPEVRQRAESLIEAIVRQGEETREPGNRRPSVILGRGDLSDMPHDLPRLLGPADRSLEAALRQLDELLGELHRPLPPASESLRRHFEWLDQDLEARIRALREQAMARLQPGGTGTEGRLSGATRIQVWRDGRPLLDRTRTHEIAEVASLGAAVESVSAALRAHLPIPEGEGLLVSHVAPGSIAESCGLREYDILLRLDGRPVTTVADLRERSAAALRSSLPLQILRGGALLELQLTLQPRRL